MARELPLDTSAVATAVAAGAATHTDDCEVARALADAYDTTAEPDSNVDGNRPFSWDERRKLALDIVHLAPPDQPGVLLLAHAFATKHSDSSRAYMTQRDFAPPPISQWDAAAAHIAPAGAIAPTATTSSNALQLECGVDLDTADPELLHRLRTYVDSCYVPHFVPKENCSICEGLWSCGRVVACGNDACGTRIHEECFGVVLRDPLNGPWRCPSCLLGRPLQCVMCLQFGGALKPVASVAVDTETHTKWVHALCALAIPELVLRDVPTLEPVDGIDAIENSRFRYLCNICRKRGGASIICDNESCNVGMHPLCAASAGLMVGSDGYPLAVYCEKHLPAMRVVGAKRLISDEDLVEEIVSEPTSVDADDDFDDDLDTSDGDVSDVHPTTDSQRYAFILASTPYVVERTKLLGDRATLPWGSKADSNSGLYNKRMDVRPKMFERTVRRPTPAWSMARDAGGWRVRRPYVFPPSTTSQSMGLAPFPAPRDLVGAFVELAVPAASEPTDWLRARVVSYDTTKHLHSVQIVSTGQQLAVTLAASNTLVLKMRNDTNVLDGPRVRLVRAVTNGEVQWRPKPQTFGRPAAGSAQSSSS